MPNWSRNRMIKLQVSDTAVNAEFAEEGNCVLGVLVGELNLESLHLS